VWLFPTNRVEIQKNSAKRNSRYQCKASLSSFAKLPQNFPINPSNSIRFIDQMHFFSKCNYNHIQVYIRKRERIEIDPSKFGSLIPKLPPSHRFILKLPKSPKYPSHQFSLAQASLPHTTNFKFPALPRFQIPTSPYIN
jgi:hypothetical protein